MYDNLKISSRCANATRAFVEASIKNYEESKNVKTADRDPFLEETDMVIESVMRREGAAARYQSFSETVRNVLLTETLYKLYKNSVISEYFIKEASDLSVMRSIVSHYVNENGYDNILRNMKSASIATSKLYNTVTESVKYILECVDKNDPNTFVITNDMKDEFFKQLDYSDTDALSKAINDRVATAMDDFVTANRKDHDDINEALKRAQEKIDDAEEKEDTELKESYEFEAKRKISKIRNNPKGIFHSMVSAMSESVLTKPAMQNEFMTEGHLNMDKIVARTGLMYTFLEMLNTSKIEKIDGAYLESVITELKK